MCGDMLQRGQRVAIFPNFIYHVACMTEAQPYPDVPTAYTKIKGKPTMQLLLCLLFGEG